VFARNRFSWGVFSGTKNDLREDPFRTEARLTTFLSTFCTYSPPEPRFDGRQKNRVIRRPFHRGDRALRTAWYRVPGRERCVERTTDGAWRQVGAPHSGFLGSTVLKIDESLPERSPSLGDANFPGAMMILRHAFGTETAVWLINGDFYRDHYRCDFGGVRLYALAHPFPCTGALCISRGCQVPGCKTLSCLRRR
jgi:hypothetical protein